MISHIGSSLNWSQKAALIRNALHAAVRSGDFTFFKALQAQGFLEGVNHVAILANSLGDEGDRLIVALDDLNAGLAHIFEDAFKTIFIKWKDLLSRTNPGHLSEMRSNLFVDCAMQRQIADLAIDKTINSLITMIEQHPQHVQETAISIWAGGLAIIADAIETCVKHMAGLQERTDDFIRMEDSWSTVAVSVTSAITALRGVYNLMDSSASDCNSEYSPSRRSSISGPSSVGVVFRKLSNAFAPASPAQSRSSSFACKDNFLPPRNGIEMRTGTSLRSSVSGACPSSMPENGVAWRHTELGPVPPTPGPDRADPFEDIAPETPTPKQETAPTVLAV